MHWRETKERIAFYFMRGAVVFANLLLLLIIIGLVLKAWPILSSEPLAELFFSSSWFPMKGEFGFLPFITGTVYVTLLSMAIAVPICILSALYLSEFAPSRVRNVIRPVIDILAGIPSVIYGLWGVIVIVPFVRWLGTSIGVHTTGYSLLAGGIILAIMVFPIIISVSLEIMRNVPAEARETCFSLGATKWEVVKCVVMRGAIRGIIASVVLGFARAFGETIAVLMVVGNVAKIPNSLFEPAYPLASLIANNYGEMMSVPMYDSALMLAALILLLVVAGFNIGAHYFLWRLRRRGIG
jgi:phosphate transport system permease protein